MKTIFFICLALFLVVMCASIPASLADDWYESEEATSYSSLNDHMIAASCESLSPSNNNAVKAFVPETLRDNKQMDDLVAQETGNATEIARAYDVPEDSTIFEYSGVTSVLGCQAAEE
ncbi:MAG: hypothetical protein PHH49_05675 [Candidatus Omnitrophica bacterium]|nr:hypothetical protein [Candidatus Omnitrophota bacterium]MDD5488432.1 hypothetical protein [Candidatus Omnitrophota bacterium]